MKRESRAFRITTPAAAFAFAATLAVAPAAAQQVIGVPGSPSATTSIDGKQLPPPPPKFGGVIKESAKDSTPWWPPRVVPPKGAPNVLLIMTDDQGYGVPGTFGGVIPTPALDRIAKAGLRYTQFNSTALCSPTRAALITGRNHHSVGFGVISELSTGYPGYDSIIGPENATVGRILADNGYATSWFGSENAGIPVGNSPSILNKSFTITAEIEVPSSGGNGMIVTEGGRFGGYALYLLKGRRVFVYNLLDLKRSRWEGGVGGADWLGKSLKPGKHTIVFDFKYDGPGIAKGGTGVLTVDGRVLATQKLEHTIPFLLPPDETFDVGVDTRTPVDSSYQIPFRFDGKIDKLTFKLGASQLTASDERRVQEAVARARD